MLVCQYRASAAILVDVVVGFDDHMSLYHVPVDVLRGLDRSLSAEDVKDVLLDNTTHIDDADYGTLEQNHGLFLDAAFDTPTSEFFASVDACLAHWPVSHLPGPDLPESSPSSFANLLDGKARKADKQPLTAQEREEVVKRFGKDTECSFARDEDGIYCYTHRARSKSYDSVAKIAQSRYEFICSTG